MKKLLLILSATIAAPALASSDCQSAYEMLYPTVPLVIQVAQLHQNNADYKTIAQWRSQTFNPQIEQIIDAHQLTPKDMMNPELELTRNVYNDVMMRSKIYVNQVYSYSRGSVDAQAVGEQITIINNVINQYKEKCEV